MSVLTRIKNNQIFDSTIFANAKIAAGTITGNLFSNNMTISSNVTITGNLTVQGGSTYLTVASTNTYVNDPLILLNNAFAGTNTNDIGLLFNRGSLDTVGFVWNEGNDEFRLLYTADGSTVTGAITPTSYGNLRVGNLAIVNNLVMADIFAEDMSLSGDLGVNGGDITSNVTSFNLLNNTVTTANVLGAATTINLGATSGTLTVNNPVVVGTQTSQDLYNTVTTSLNFAGAATTLTIGATSGTANIRNANIYFPNATTFYSGQSTISVFDQPTTIDAFKAATDLEFGATSGTLTINNPTVVGTQSTQNLYNTAATTLNFAGAATTFTLGATSGTASLRNANIWLPNMTSLDGAQGTIQVLGNATTVTAFIGATTANIGATTGTLTINNPTVVGTQATQNLYNTAATTLNFAGDATALTVGATSGTASIRNANIWLPNMTSLDGVQGSISLFNNATTVTAFAGASTANIALTATNLNLGGTGGTATINNDTINLEGNVNINETTTSINPTTGALVVDGGIGLGGNINLNGQYIGTPQTTFYFANANVTTLDIAGAASTVNMGANSGTFTLRNPTLVGTETTQNVYNTVATTLNAFGAATTVTLGATSGTMNLRNANINLPNASTIYTGQTSVTLANVNTTTLNAFGAATTLNLGANSGTATLRNPTLVGTETTQNVYNTIASTVNAFGAATALTMGATTGYTNIRNANLWLPNATTVTFEQSTVAFANTNVTTLGIGGAASTVIIANPESFTNVQGNLKVLDTQDSTTWNNGALTVAGGVGIAGNVHIQGNLYVANLISTTEEILVIKEPLVYLEPSNVYPYSYDIGIFSAFTGGPGNVYQHTAFIREYTDEKWHLAANLAEPAGGVVDLTTARYETLVLGNVEIRTAEGIYTTQSSANVFNQTATTVNVGGAATSLNLGATTGTATLRNPTLVGTESTQNVYNTVATTVNAFGEATALNFGANTGTLTLRNPTVVGTESTQALYNTVATTLNFAGAATTLNIGADTGTATINNDTINLEGNVNVNKTTTSVNPTTGALVVDGGIGLGGNINLDGQYIGTPQTTFYFANANVTSLNIGGSATSLNLGANSGTATLRNPTLVGTETTQNVYNTVATTVNAFGDATTITLGATTGTANIRNANVFLPNATTLFTGQASVTLANVNTTTLNAFGAATTLNLGANSGTITLRNPTLVGTETIQNVYNTVATTVNAFGAAATLNLGASTGTATINNQIVSLPFATNIHTAQSSITLANISATTVNAFGAATELNFASGTGNTRVRNNFTALGKLFANNNSDSTSTTTGALVVTGGAGISANVYVGGNVNVASNISSTTYNTGTMQVVGGFGIFGNINIKDGYQLGVGNEISGYDILPDTLAQFTSQVASYAQVNMQNMDSGTNSSTNYVATADNGSDTTNFINFGIVNSNYDNTTPTNGLGTSLQASDGYLYVQGDTSLTPGGNLVLGTVTTGRVTNFIAGGSESSNIVATVRSTSFDITQSTPATSQTSGALRVTGGAGFGTNIYVANGAVINNSQSSENFIVRGQSEAHLIFANSVAGTVTIGSNAYVAGATLNVDAVDSLRLPVGLTGERPTGVTGMIRFNSERLGGIIEYYDGSSWAVPGSVSFTPIEGNTWISATGNPYGNVNGVNTEFLLPDIAETVGTFVTINGVFQVPDYSYSISGNVLTFVEPPEVGDIIDARIITTTTSVTSLVSASGYNRVYVDGQGVHLASGTTFSTEHVRLEPEGTLALREGTKQSYDQTVVNVPTSGVPVIVDSFSANTYTSAKYVVQTRNGTDQLETMEALVVALAGNAYITTYGVIAIDDYLGTLSANIVAGNVNLYYTSTSYSNSNVKVQASYIKA